MIIRRMYVLQTWMRMMEYQIPDTDVLEDKYIVTNPTTIDESGLEIKENHLLNSS